MWNNDTKFMDFNELFFSLRGQDKWSYESKIFQNFNQQDMQACRRAQIASNTTIKPWKNFEKLWTSQNITTSSINTY